MFFSVFNGFNIIMSKIKIIILMYFQAKFTLKNILHHNTKHVSQRSTTNVYFVYGQLGGLRNALYIVSSLIKEFVSN